VRACENFRQHQKSFAQSVTIADCFLKAGAKVRRSVLNGNPSTQIVNKFKIVYDPKEEYGYFDDETFVICLGRLCAANELLYKIIMLHEISHVIYYLKYMPENNFLEQYILHELFALLFPIYYRIEKLIKGKNRNL
jgi:hypothetical protein